MRAGGAQEIREVRAGGAQEIRETDERAGVAREADEFADNSVEETRNAAGGEAVEVLDKVEEPGVDAKVVEDPDLARSQLLEEPPGAAKEVRQYVIKLLEE